MIDFGYCCNVHSGVTIDEVKTNLDRYATEVKRQVSSEDPLRIGLWLSQSALLELETVAESEPFGGWLFERGLVPFTINGFPFGNFHQDIVKHDVYRPTWAEPSRLDYTVSLAKIQQQLLAQNVNWQEPLQTISTLPLGWPEHYGENTFDTNPEFLNRCASQLRELVDRLSDLESSTGSQTMVCVEPEPGCVLDTARDIVRFFEQHLLTGDAIRDDRIRRHIGVCHDVCHSAVMFEDQLTAVRAYKSAGIAIGKVQVSSAVEVDFDSDIANNAARLLQLTEFSEPKYLHQTSLQNSTEQAVQYFEDLPLALASQTNPQGTWKVHFHVPIFAQRLDLLNTTQHQISQFLDAIAAEDVQVPHFEIETYAWNVLPENQRFLRGDLASGIAAEMKWFGELVNSKAL